MTEFVLQQHVLLAVLRHHIGRANGATARDLVAEYNSESAKLFGPGADQLTERGLRSVVTELRLQGHHLCAHPRSGYFIAETAEELLETLDFLEGRAKASFQQASAMRQTSLGALFGQRVLPT